MTATHASHRTIIAAGIGNCLELFDLTVFGFFAAIIGSHFFPSKDPVSSILNSFATFAIGFLMRPIGALVLSSIGDRFGRKRLLTTTMLLMGLASLGIAVLPTYAQIGLWAPVLLVIFRLLQGFAAGGEWGGAVTMMVEHAPAHKKGFVGSFQQVGFGLGIVLGTLFVLFVNTVLSEADRDAWGWRLPFLFGALVAPLAFYIRRGADESPEYVSIRSANKQIMNPVRHALRHHGFFILCVIGIGTLGTAAGYISNQFMNAFAVRTLHLPAHDVSLALTLASLLQLVLLPVWGWLSDYTGKLRIIGWAAVIYTLLIYPDFHWLVTAPSLTSLHAVVIPSAILVSASFAPLPALLSLYFPPEVRTTAISIGYNIAAALFGGFAPLVSTWLIGATGHIVAPTYYAIFCGLITIVTFAAVRAKVPHLES